MKVKSAKKSIPARAWVKPWMIWVSGFVFFFIPNFLWDLITLPIYLARYHWVGLRDEVESFDCNTQERLE